MQQGSARCVRQCVYGGLNRAPPGHRRGMRGGGGLTAIYLIIGAFVAGAHHYFTHLTALEGVLSAVLAILLWPLLFVGIDFHVNL